MDEFDKWHVLRGRSLIKGTGIPDLIEDLTTYEAVWNRSKDELLPEWIAEKPGTRPLPWWLFDHGNERPVINPMQPESEAAARREHTYAGFLHTSILHGYGARKGEMHPFQEPEEDYLERLGLLSYAEREALESDDDESDPSTFQV